MVNIRRARRNALVPKLQLGNARRERHEPWRRNSLLRNELRRVNDSMDAVVRGAASQAPAWERSAGALGTIAPHSIALAGRPGIAPWCCIAALFRRTTPGLPARAILPKEWKLGSFAQCFTGQVPQSRRLGRIRHIHEGRLNAKKAQTVRRSVGGATIMSPSPRENRDLARPAGPITEIHSVIEPPAPPTAYISSETRTYRSDVCRGHAPRTH